MAATVVTAGREEEEAMEEAVSEVAAMMAVMGAAVDREGEAAEGDETEAMEREEG